MGSATLTFLVALAFCPVVNGNQTKNGWVSEEDMTQFKRKVFEIMNQQITKQNDIIAKQEKTISDLTEEMRTMKGEHLMLQQRMNQFNRYDVVNTSSVYGCDLDMLNLTCENGAYINVTTAYYGQYAVSCSGCCPPGQEDCQEVMSENRPSDWLALKYTCDGKTQCQFQNLGSHLESCASPYDANYLDVYYDCLVEDIPPTQDPVAFSAYSSGYQDYSQHETIIFDTVLINLGDSYDPVTSTFTCPRDGVYVFSVSIMRNSASDALGATIVHGSADTLMAYVTYENSLGQSATTTVIKCDAGEKVLCQSVYSTENVFGSQSERYTSFTGFLIHSY